MQIRIRAARRVVAGIAAGLALAAVAVAPATASAATVPGVLGIDHMGITVPNAAKARAWFVNVLGCSSPLSFGPFADPKGTLMHDLLGVRPRAVVQHIEMVRCGTGSSIELLQYEAPGQSHRLARNSDIAGHHVAFYVTDIKRAVAYMEAHHVHKLMGPFPVTEGPAAGQTINYFRTPFGLYIELISYPDGEAYAKTAETKLWNPADVGAKPVHGGLPGLLGVDHFGMTVPDVAKARRWFHRTLGCTAPLRFGPFSDPTGNLMKNLLEVPPRSVVSEIDVLRCGANGANLELLEYHAPGQRRDVPLNSDYAANHIGVYVRNIGKAVKAMRGHARKLLGPFAVTDGPAAGQTINYFLPPIKHYLELISYPHGMAYEKDAHPPLWSPRRPRS